MKNEYKITKEEMMSWAKEYHLLGAANIIVFVLWCLIGIVALGTLLLLCIRGGHWFQWLYAIILLALAVYKLFFARFVIWSNRYKIMAKTYGVSEWVRSVEFTDEEIVMNDHTSTTKLKYENIKKVKEYDKTVTVIFNNNMAFRLHKDAFTEGSWEECQRKLQEKRQ